ncbi:Oidioi.mRNA.OKI2018_I69.chr1.g1528.t1.cds [Oikopleura dioica]|uniref:Oidioi.mRNA.OKI2018_I69.chr1.g1528.t1.cds n=1 Tax=Oikopleura dioica TaxID=34765 RepID=A0ABN7SSF9_OIKDI|nr:Oidioi.mRNA.OKI2018_I69.chr1.g1528.t1.cds [Oikopleura dioica]
MRLYTLRDFSQTTDDAESCSCREQRLQTLRWNLVADNAQRINSDLSRIEYNSPRQMWARSYHQPRYVPPAVRLPTPTSTSVCTPSVTSLQPAAVFPTTSANQMESHLRDFDDSTRIIPPEQAAAASYYQENLTADLDVMMATQPEFCLSAENPVQYEIPFVDESGLQFDQFSPIGSFLRGDFISELFEAEPLPRDSLTTSSTSDDAFPPNDVAEEALSHLLPDRLQKIHQKALMKEKKLGDSMVFPLKLRHKATQHCRELQLLFPKDAALLNSLVENKIQSFDELKNLVFSIEQLNEGRQRTTLEMICKRQQKVFTVTEIHQFIKKALLHELRTARFGSRINGLWEIEIGFPILKYKQCDRCADYVYVGRAGDSSKIYQKHRSSCSGKLCHGCQDTFGSIESYNNHLSSCSRDHEVEVIVKEMDQRHQKFPNQYWKCCYELKNKLAGLQSNQHHSKCQLSICRKCWIRVPREHLELHEETHIDVNQDDVDQLETTDSGMNQGDMSPPSQVAHSQGSLGNDDQAAESQGSQEGQSSSKAESKAQSYPSDASSGFKASVREPLIKKAEEEVRTAISLLTTAEKNRLLYQFIDGNCASSEVESLNAQLLQASAFKTATANLPKSVKTQIIKNLTPSKPSKKILSGLSKFFGRRQDRVLKMKNAKNEAYRSKDQLRNVSMELLINLDQFLKSNSFCDPSKRGYVTISTKNVKDDTIFAFYKKNCHLTKTAKRGLEKFESPRLVLEKPLKTLYFSFLAAFPEYEHLSFKHFKDMCPFYIYEEHDRSRRICACLKERHTNLNNFIDAINRIGETARANERLGAIGAELATLSIDVILNESTCRLGPNATTIVDCIRNRNGSCFQHMKKTTGCSHCLHQDCTGVDKWIQEKIENHWAPLINEYGSMKIGVSRFESVDKGDPRCSFISETEVGSGKITVKEVFEHVQARFRSYLEHWVDKNENEQELKTLDDSPVPAGVLQVESDYASKTRLKANTETQSAFLSSEGNINVLTSVVKFTIDGKPMKYYFHFFASHKCNRNVRYSEGIILQELRQRGFTFDSLMRISDNAPSEFKSYEIINQLRDTDVDIPTCLVYKTPVHGKSSVDGAHTAVNNYLRKATLYNLASNIPDAIKYCQERESEKDDERDDKEEFQGRIFAQIPSDLVASKRNDLVRIPSISSASMIKFESGVFDVKSHVCTCEFCRAGRIHDSESGKQVEVTIKKKQTMSLRNVAKDEHIMSYRYRDDITALADDFLSSRTDQDTSLILVPVVTKPTSTNQLHHLTLIRVCSEQYEIQILDTSLDRMDQRERHRLITISHRIAALIESDAPLTDYENWDISFAKNIPSSSEFCAPLLLEICRQELSQHPKPVEMDSIRSIMTDQLRLIDHPVLKLTSSDDKENAEVPKQRKRKLDFSMPFGSVENLAPKRRSQRLSGQADSIRRNIPSKSTFSEQSTSSTVHTPDFMQEETILMQPLRATPKISDARREHFVSTLNDLFIENLPIEVVSMETLRSTINKDLEDKFTDSEIDHILEEMQRREEVRLENNDIRLA